MYDNLTWSTFTLAMTEESNFTQQQKPIFVAIGVLSAVIVALIIGVVIRFCRKKSSDHGVDQVALSNQPSTSTTTNPQNVYDYAIEAAPSTLMVDNELYTAAIINDFDEGACGVKEPICSKPNKQKSEMIDNELYKAFEL